MRKNGRFGRLKNTSVYIANAIVSKDSSRPTLGTAATVVSCGFVPVVGLVLSSETKRGFTADERLPPHTILDLGANDWFDGIKLEIINKIKEYIAIFIIILLQL